MIDYLILQSEAWDRVLIGIGHSNIKHKSEMQIKYLNA